MEVLLNEEEYYNLTVEFLNYRIDKPELFEASLREIDTIFHHYTDLNGLIGIVENQCLFASDIRFVNDKAELKYGLELVEEVAKRITNEENKSILTFLIDNLENFFPANRYIACFSTNGDLLQQWQSYARNAMGVSIGFEFNKNILKDIKLIPRVTARKIIYNREKQISLIELYINYTLDFFQKKYSDLHNQKVVQIISHFIVDSLSDAVSSFKHPCFSHENEYRLFYLPKENDKPSIRFRNNGKLIIPYVKIETEYRYYSNEMAKPDNEWGDMPTILEPLLPIKEIFIGPGLDYEAVKAGVEILLRENGYRGVNIVKSELPYRP